MRKGLVLVLIFFYFLSISGGTLFFHHCGDTFKYLGFTPDKDDKGCCGKKSKKKCCRDKTVKLTNKDHRSGVSKYILHSPVSKTLPCVIFNIYNKDFKFAANRSVVLRPPPLYDSGPPLYILQSVFKV
ncbi:MAG: hypothetical protein P4L41_06055 [Flavipsychrobacter sp.]|nr:hypothetical protein [Flavipsychrobacter sp.]